MGFGGSRPFEVQVAVRGAANARGDLGLGASAVSVDAYGAAGDGATDDTAAINLALASGYNVRFTPGKTYLVSGTLSVPAGIEVALAGATVKRAAQAATTLTGTVNSGVANPTLGVASTAGFAVGSTVSLRTGGSVVALALTSGGSGYSGSPTVTITDPTGAGSGATATATVSGGVITALNLTAAGTGYLAAVVTITDGTGSGAAGIVRNLNTTDESSSAHKITAIGAGTITIAGTLAATWASGATLYTCGYTFDLNGNNRLVGPGVIDGNRANSSVAYWGSTAAVRVNSNGSNSTIQGLEIKNAPGEGIVCYGSYNTVQDCYVHDLNGNGVHFTNSPAHIVCTRVRVVNPNGNGSVNHADGGIIWSDTITDATVTECFISGTALSGIGSIDAASNSDVTVANNTIRNCALYAVAINPGNAADSPAHLLIAGNRCYASGPIFISATNGSATTFPNRIVVSGNYIDTSANNGDGISLSKARFVAIVGNVVENTNSSTAVGIKVFDAKFIVVSGNVINGFSYGIRLANSTTEAVAITGNQLTNFHNVGILAGTGMGPGISISGNSLDGDSTVTSAVVGITLGDAISCTGNSIYLSTGSASVGISVTGSNNSVQSNQVRGAAGRPVTGINLAASTTGNVVANNAITSSAGTAINLNATTINSTSAGSGNYTTA